MARFSPISTADIVSVHRFLLHFYLGRIKCSFELISSQYLPAPRASRGSEFGEPHNLEAPVTSYKNCHRDIYARALLL